ncbi:coiled-coil domain-containing protein 33 [Chanos chanos]|uniref:Coiled-coil domain-containing protein 33 n=1 Tax=Chanos chanos TaxID=29144 RepID=A0A6J2UPH3_CHACN|nr:coiled-coil domain-containing protein 33 [Chanos chanos]
MQRERIKIEEKDMDFVFEVVSVQFNQLGQYQLRLTVENPLLVGSGTEVQLRLQDGETIQTSSSCTDTIEQTSLDEVYTFMCNKFVFTLPKGFCKNDKNHDVRLKVEALRLMDSEVKAGEGFFAIYPRTNAPRINLYAGPKEELYRYYGIMALLRVQDDYLAMHCGRLVYSVAFHEARPFVPLHSAQGDGGPGVPPSPGSTAPQVPCLILGSSETQDAVTAPQGLSALQGPECMVSPLPEPQLPENTLLLITATNFNYIEPEADCSHYKKNAVQIRMSGEDETRGWKSQGVTHCPPLPTHCPSWEESVSLGLQDQQALTEVVILSVADSRTKELLAYFRLPVTHLQPFRHYHLELVQAHRMSPTGVRLYVTMVRKLSLLPGLPCFSFTGLEVLLKAMRGPLKEPVGPLVAVARVVPDYDSYRAQCQGAELGLVPPRVTAICQLCPLPQRSSQVLGMLTPQSVPRGATHSGPTVDPQIYRAPVEQGMTFFNLDMKKRQAQMPADTRLDDCDPVSRVGLPPEQPVWNHCFLFLGRDCATIFTGRAALVLEYYPIGTAVSSFAWYLRSPVAFSGLCLDQLLYRKLLSEEGLRVDRLPLQGSSLQTSSDTAPSVSILLRLIGSELDITLLPCLDTDLQEEEQDSLLTQELSPYPETDMEQTVFPAPSSLLLSDLHIPQQLNLQRDDDYHLLSHDALAKILPEYKHLFKTPDTQNLNEKDGGAQSKNQEASSQLNKTFEVPSSSKRPQIPDSDEPVGVTERQTKELENYRTAMCKMAEDIIALRTQVSSLESENSHLRSDLSLQHDLGRSLLDETDLDVMTKTEIADTIKSLKLKLATESSKAASQRDKIQQLQNQLIRKNDSEKELLRLRGVHQQQQTVLLQYQSRMAKMASLETTIRQQEKVIERMERILDTKLREINKENSEKKKKMTGPQKGEDDSKIREMESALVAENSRLREEVERLRAQPPPVIIQQPAQQALQPFSDREKLSLLCQLEKAEVRIRTLESQLEKNSMQWGKERQELLCRLSEHEYGFVRTSAIFLHDPPVKSVSDSMLGRFRHRQLKPLK